MHMPRRKKYRLKQNDIVQNSGKEISHTISKIKAHERFYTTILVIIFMVIITTGAYFALRITPSKIKDTNIYIDENGFSYSTNLVFLNNSTVDQKNGNEYTINISNKTEKNENYVIKLSLNEDFIKKCNCDDQLVTIDKIRYTIDNGVERKIDNSDMILSTGFIRINEINELKVKMWLEDIDQEEESYFYGKLEIIPFDEV
jgi:hypothetical protein